MHRRFGGALMGGPSELVPAADLQLPAPLVGVAATIGLQWPTTSERELFAIGARYLELSGRCRGARETIDLSSTEMLIQNHSPAMTAFRAFQARLVGLPLSHMVVASTGLAVMGGAYLSAGFLVLTMKARIILIVARAAVSIAVVSGATAVHPAAGAAVAAIDSVAAAALEACHTIVTEGTVLLDQILRVGEQAVELYTSVATPVLQARAVDRERAAMAAMTLPSLPPGPTNVPRGRPEDPEPNADRSKKRALRLEKQAALVLARLGYDVEQQPRIPGRKRPDYRIEGRIFDCVAPTTRRARNIASRVWEKVEEGQTRRVLLYMHGNPTSLEEIRHELRRYEGTDLEEVMVLTEEGTVVHLFP